MKVSEPEIRMGLGGEMYLTVRVDPESRQDAQNAALELKDKPIRMDVKAWRDRRSLDANAYLWVLCNKLAVKLRCTSEEVYKAMIRDYGVREYLSIRTDAIETFGRAIQATGHIGSFIEPKDATGGYTWIAVYVGSSAYDKAEMAALIDGVISECKDQGIETITPNEKAKMMGLWGEEQKETDCHGACAPRNDSEAAG